MSRLLWVVRDVGKTAAAWSKSGVPTSAVREVAFTDGRARVATSWFGNVTADWMQPVSPGPLNDFLQRKGGGMFAVLHGVDSPAALEAESARLRGLGVAPLLAGTYQAEGGPIRYVLFDTAAEGKYVLGLTVTPPGFEDSVSRGRNVTQFAFLANDLERVSAYWARLGLPALTYTHPELTELVYRGQPGRFRMRLGWQRHGKVPYEWIQPLQGPSGYHEHLEKHGEGFHHLGFPVEDMDAAIREWEGWGFPMTMGGAWGVKGKPGSGRFAYHDLHAVASADIELLWSYRDRAAELERLQPEQFTVKDAGVAVDRRGAALTITFRYARDGEPEVRIPARVLGWPQDWRAWRGLTFEFQATSLEPFQVGFFDGTRMKAIIIEPLAGLRMRAAIPFDAFVQTRTRTPLLPLGYKAWPQRLFTFERVDELCFRMRAPSQDSQLTLYSLALSEADPKDDILDRRPVIDRYGQWIPEKWPGKAHSDEDLRAAWDQDRLAGARYPFCPLGGDPSQRQRATGFYRTERLDGRWVLIDPHGHSFFSAGMDLVGYRQGSFATRVTGREFLYEQLPPAGAAWLTPGSDVSFYVANIMKRFGENWEVKWRDHILARLRDWGFNTIANWSDRELAVGAGMPYVLPLSGWTTNRMFPFPWDFPDVFSEEFDRNVEDAARRLCAPLKNDSNLIGWFIGNEPHWARNFSSLTPWADMLLADPEPSATKAELQRRLTADPANVARIKDQWVFACGRRYFETIQKAIRRHDPNHLILGIRFAGSPSQEWIQMSSLFDVFSVNIYSPAFAPDPAQVKRFADLSGRPVLIGEFTACTPGRGLQGLFYWVHKVKDQAERGIAYRYYVERAAADPHIVGAHWFQMVDDLPTGRPSDQERLNYGFLDVLDLPYPDLVRAARETHARLYGLKFRRVKPFARKPEYN